MMMTNFLARMNRVVGDRNTVARYLVEKIGHVALIAWCLVYVGGFPPLWSALIAAAFYDIVGKVLWYVEHRTFDGLDMVFDLIVVLLPALLAETLVWGYGWMCLACCGWLGVLALFDNNQWGSPS